MRKNCQISLPIFKLVTVVIHRKRTHDGMYSMVKTALLLGACDSWDPEKEEDVENASEDARRREAVTRVAMDFMFRLLLG